MTLWLVNEPKAAARGYFRLKSRVHSTHSSLTAYSGVSPSVSSSSSAGVGAEGGGTSLKLSHLLEETRPYCSRLLGCGGHLFRLFRLPLHLLLFLPPQLFSLFFHFLLGLASLLERHLHFLQFFFNQCPVLG